MSWHRKKFLATERNFLSQEKISCPRNLGWNFMSQWVVFIRISIYFWKKFPVHVEIWNDNISFTWRKSLQRKKFALLIKYYFAVKNFFATTFSWWCLFAYFVQVFNIVYNIKGMPKKCYSIFWLISLQLRMETKWDQ